MLSPFPYFPHSILHFRGSTSDCVSLLPHDFMLVTVRTHYRGRLLIVVFSRCWWQGNAEARIVMNATQTAGPSPYSPLLTLPPPSSSSSSSISSRSTPADVRLVDGPTPLSGRLQIFYAGHWRSVCTNSRKYEFFNFFLYSTLYIRSSSTRFRLAIKKPIDNLLLPPSYVYFSWALSSWE